MRWLPGRRERRQVQLRPAAGGLRWPGRRGPQQHQPAAAGLRAGAEGVPATDDGRSQVATVSVLGWDASTKSGLIAEEPTTATGVSCGHAAVGGRRVRLARLRDREPATNHAGRGGSRRQGVRRAARQRLRRGDRDRGRNPRLKAGASVNVSLVAAPFAGRYTLTHTRHVFDKKGYRTHLEMSGRQERTLLSLASGGGGSDGSGSSVRGVQVGLVTDNQDPDNHGRVRVQLPYFGPDFVTNWARVVAPETARTGASCGFRGPRRGPRGVPPRGRQRAIRVGWPLESEGSAPVDRARTGTT